MMRNTPTQLVLAFIEMMTVFLAENCPVVRKHGEGGVGKLCDKRGDL